MYEIYWKTLVTKDQMKLIIAAMDVEAAIPKKGLMQVLDFPNGDVGYITWTKAVSEGGDRLYSYELAREAKQPEGASA
jgi:hypothetical protein